MEATFETKVTNNFRKHYAATKKIVVSEGGGRSGKTFSILQLLIGVGLQNRNKLISVVAENVPFLKRGAINDFKSIMQSMELWNVNDWRQSESKYYLPTGSVIEFFAADNAGKALGAARDYLFINEANNIKYEIAFQLMARTNERVFIDYNPRSEFWVHSELLRNPEFDNMIDFIHSTFADNQLLNENIRLTMLARAAKDENYKRVYVDGLIGSLDGLIFPDFTTVDEMPGEVNCYGLDFGYTNDPTAIVGVIVTGDTIYLDEITYQTQLRNIDIDRELRNNAVSKLAPIYADSAEPKSIDDLYLMGWNIHPAIKGRDSIMYGIDLMKQYKIVVTKRSTALIRELRNYTFARDKEGNALNAPIDGWNHLVDASRYAVTMLQRNKHEYQQTRSNDFNYMEL